MFKKGWLATLLIMYAVTIGYGADNPATPAESNTRSISIITEKPYTRRYQPLVAAVEKEMRSLDIPGAAIAIVEAGETTFAAGFGSKHPHRDDPVQPSTLFRIGSVTKTLTAIGLLQVIEQGLVDINGPITDYLPDFSFARDANWAPSITVRNLLTHTSAIADYVELDTPGFKDDDALSRYYCGPYSDSPHAYLMAPAGKMFNYTNPGYALAGWVTESASGTYYRHYIRENVLAPLEMMRTFFLPEEVIADGDFAYGSTLYLETGEPFIVEPDSYDSGWGRPAGWAFSNVLDLAQIVKFLRAGKPEILTDEMRIAMQEPQVDWEMFLDLIHYGYGLIVEEAGFYHPTESYFYRLRIVSHGGDVPGFSADLYYVPDLDLGFVALTNASLAHLDTSFATALTTLREMPTPSSIPNLSMTPAEYANYAGQYYDPYTAGNIFVETNNGQLTVEIPTFDEVGLGYSKTLIPNTPNNFILVLYGIGYFDVFPRPVTFILDNEGVSEYFRTRGFVAHYESAILPEPGRPGRFNRMSTESYSASHFRRLLPEPRLPFVRPPGQ
jgi:CubicO group peptidase (beta-lactamase class C family)